MTRAACSKDISNFFYEGSKPDASGHETKFYLDSRAGKTRWVLKEFIKPELAQIEAGMAAIYFALSKPNTIPKVYAVYRAAGEIFASVSAVFSEFQDLKAYLSSGLDEEKLSFLIENGFPEICALSYFLEEDDLHKGNIGISDGNVVRIDFDMSAFSVVGRPELRGPRSSVDFRRLEETFTITAKDIEHFPELLDAKPCYFPGIFHMASSANGYTTDEVKKLKALQKDPRFVRRAYLLFLKIILMPDAIFSNLLSAHVGDAKRVLEFSEHFIRRKQDLRDLLLQKNELSKFKNFLETLSSEEIRSIFCDINEHNLKNKFQFQQIDLNMVRSHFYHFIFDSMKAGDLFRFLDMTANAAKSFSENDWAVLKKAHAELLRLYEWLTEKELLLLEDIDLFVKEMKTNLDLVKNLFVSPNEQINALYANITQRLSRLEKNTHAAELSERGCGSPAEEFDMVDFPVDYEEQLNQLQLVHDVIQWMQQESRQSVVVVIFEKMIAEMKAQQAVFWARLSSAVASAASSASSFFRTPSTSVPAMESQLQKFLADFKVDNQILYLFFRLLSLTGDGAEHLKNQIIFNLIAQFVREFSAKKPVEQMQIDPVLAGFLGAHGFFSYPSASADKLIALFKDEVKPLLARFVEPEAVCVVASKAA